MNLPLERSLAVLWAGGLLVQLNGDRRATQIRGDVAASNQR